jgi:hypothetical protein
LSYGQIEAQNRIKGMNIPKNRGIFALACYLIIIGVCGAFGIKLGVLSVLVPCLAIVAGVLLLMEK